MMLAINNPNAPIERYFAPPDVHAENRAPGGGFALGLVVALVLTVVHALNLYFFLAAPVAALLVHFVIVLVSAVVIRAIILTGADSRFLMVLLVSSAALSIFGTLGTVLCTLLYLWHSRRSLPFSEWFESMFPSRILSAPEQVNDDILIGRDEAPKAYTVLPFLDIMTVGSDAQKREALSKMTMRFHPRFAPAFKKALQDESNMIRVQAATAITKIENAFLTRLMKLTELYQRFPRDPVVVLAIAQHCDDYAFTGVLDAERERDNREKALYYYNEYIKLSPRDENAHIAIGRLYVRDGDAARAADWLRDCVAQGFRSDTLMGWYVEALYAAKRYTELRNVAVSSIGLIETFRVTQPALAESLMLWSGRTTAMGGAA